jgi:hypothetical protein
MNTDEIIKEFEPLWTNKLADYVLVRNDIFTFGYIILNVHHKTMLIIENDIAAHYVLGKMLENNVRVIDDIYEVIPKDKLHKGNFMW